MEAQIAGPSKSHLAAVVARRHGLAPTSGEEVHVLVERAGERSAERVVYVFDLPGRACAYRALAWVEKTQDGRERIVTRIHGPDWRSGEAIVRAPGAPDNRR
jgi:hypothetical protein